MSRGPDPSQHGWSVAGETMAHGDGPPQGRAQRYEYRGTVGIGGMGRVRVAYDTVLGREVAIKDVVAADPGFDDRLANEAAITACLEHPGIMPVYDAGTDEHGRAWYTMRLVRGRSLDDLLHESGHDEATALRAVLSACEAVAYAHDRGIVHADLKPTNILVGRFGDVLVSDWGLARRVDEPWRIQGGTGTPGWAAPEQLAGAAPNKRSDVYSLGRLLGLVEQRRRSRILRAIVERATHASPDRRYASAVELTVELTRYLDGRRVDAYEYGAIDHLVAFAKAWRAPLAVAAVASVLLAGMGGVAVTRIAASRDAARRAEAEAVQALEATRRALSDSFAQRAVIAQEREQVGLARYLAVQALELGPSPHARGVLAAVAPAPREERVLPAPECDVVAVDRDAGEWLCNDGGELVLIRASGRIVLGTPSVHAAFTPDGIVVFDFGQVRVYDRASGAMRYREPHVDFPLQLGFVRDVQPGLPVLVGIGSLAHVVQGRVQPFPTCDSGLIDLAAQRGDRLAVACRGEGVVLLHGTERVAQWRLPDPVPRQSLSALALGPDGEVFAGTLDGTVLRLGADGGVDTVAITDVVIRDLHASRSHLVMAPERGGVRTWDRSARTWGPTLPSDAGHVVGVEGERVWTLGAQLTQWRVSGDGPVGRLVEDVGLTTVRPVSRGILLAGADGLLVLRDRDTGADIERYDLGDMVVKDATESDGTVVGLPSHGPLGQPGQHVRTGRRFGRLDGVIWEANYGQEGVLVSDDRRAQAPSGPFIDLYEGAEALWMVSAEGGVWRFDGEAMTQRDDRPGARAVATLPDGGWVVGDADGRLHFAPGAVVVDLDGVPVDLAADPSGRWVAAGMLSGQTVLVDARTHTVAAVLRGPVQRVASVAFDGDALWTASWEGVARRYDLTVLDASPGALREDVVRVWGASGASP